LTTFAGKSLETSSGSSTGCDDIRASVIPRLSDDDSQWRERRISSAAIRQRATADRSGQLKLHPHHASLDLESDVIRLLEVRKVAVGLRS